MKRSRRALAGVQHCSLQSSTWRDGAVRGQLMHTALQPLGPPLGRGIVLFGTVVHAFGGIGQELLRLAGAHRY